MADQKSIKCYYFLTFLVNIEMFASHSVNTTATIAVNSIMLKNLAVTASC